MNAFHQVQDENQDFFHHIKKVLYYAAKIKPVVPLRTVNKI
jgi:hypothetical protein